MNNLYFLSAVLSFLIIASYFSLRKLAYVNALWGLFFGTIYFIVSPLLILLGTGGDFTISGVEGIWQTVDLHKTSLAQSYIYVILLLILLFSTIILVSFFPLQSRFPKQLNRVIRGDIAVKKLWSLIIASVIIWVYKIYTSGGLLAYLFKTFATRDSAISESSRSLYLLINNLDMVLQIFILALILLIVATRISLKKSLIFFYLFAGFYEILYMMLSGNRIFIVVLAIGILVVFILKRKYRMLLVMGILLPSFVILLNNWIYVRADFSKIINIGNYSEYADKHEFIAKILNIFEGANMLLLLHVVKDYGDTFPFLNGASYIKIITPRFVQVRRIPTISVVLAKQYEPDVENLSLNSTFLGELHTNIGFYSIIFIPLFVLILRFASIASLHPLIHNLLFVIVFFSVRTTLSYVVILLILSLILIKFSRLKKGLI